MAHPVFGKNFLIILLTLVMIGWAGPAGAADPVLNLIDTKNGTAGHQVLVYEHAAVTDMDSPGYVSAGKIHGVSVSVPGSYEPAGSDIYPMLVSLHGFGDSLDAYATAMVSWFDGLEAIVVAPNDSLGTWFYGYSDQLPGGNPNTGTVVNYTERRILYYVNYFQTVYRIDPNRIYVAGGSMGGTGTISLCMRYPDIFAGGDARKAATNRRHCAWVSQCEGIWGTIASGVLNNDGVNVWDWQNMAWYAQNHHADATWIKTSHGREDSIIPYRQVAGPPTVTPMSFYDAMATYRIGHQNFWDASSHGYADPAPITLDDWWEPFWDSTCFLQLDLSFPVFTSYSADDDPGTGDGDAVGPDSQLGDNTYDGDNRGGINRWLRWNAATITDTSGEWSIDLKLSAGHGAGTETISVTPRRLQNFTVVPGGGYIWSTGGGQSGSVTADIEGLVTIPGVEVTTAWNRLTVQINTGNTPPTVEAGTAGPISLPTSQVSLDGTVLDPDDTPTTAWSKISGPGTVTFGNSALVDTTAQFGAAGTYVLQLAADDGTNPVVTDTVTVVVNPAGTGGTLTLTGPTDCEDVNTRSGMADANQDSAESWNPRMFLQSGNLDKALIRFNLAGLPSGAVITGASLQLTVEHVWTGGTVTVRRCTESWGETTATWNTRDGSTAWTTLGGTSDSTNAVQQNASTTAAVTFDVTAIVTEWAGGTANNGFLVDMQDTGGWAQVSIFESENSATASIPRLTIDYIITQESITVTLPASASEGDGVLGGQGSITLSAPASGDLLVTLASDDTTELTVPPTVLVGNGLSSATFDLTVIDDAVVDGTQTVTVTGSAAGWDSIADTMIITDNEADTDGDGMEDGWETGWAAITDLAQLTATGDFDGDGADDLLEYLADTDPTDNTDFNAAADTDSDGMPDIWEYSYFGNLDTAGDVDSDSDGLDNNEEDGYGTDPTDADSDNDTYNDGAEIAAGTDPNDPADNPGPDPKTGSGEGGCMPGGNSTAGFGLAFMLLAIGGLQSTRRV